METERTKYYVFSQLYQQDATLYNILYCCQWSTCFRRFLRPSSGAQKLHTHSIWYTSSVGESFLLTHTRGSSKASL